ncbi:hypothetical protein IAT38_001717 [Cryptococcus sp. DSM 104549]
MVELVGWVAEIDEKEAQMTLHLDDGDGVFVLAIEVRLDLLPAPPVKPVDIPTFADLRVSCSGALTTFEYLELKRKTLEEYKAKMARDLAKKHYKRKDVEVGDTVRVVGKVQGYRSRDGERRGVLVASGGGGGSIAVVDPEEQYEHAEEVFRLHKTLYSKPFVMPDLAVNGSRPEDRSGVDASLMSEMSTTTLNVTSDLLASQADIDGSGPQLRDPRKLHPSQLTAQTFRRYMLDHITQSTILAIRSLSDEGTALARSAIEAYFPEYATFNAVYARTGKPLLPINGSSVSPPLDAPHAPSLLEAFTVSSVLADPRLNTLARLVVDREIYSEEKKRRRRFKNGESTSKDKAIEKNRKADGRPSGKHYALTEEERGHQMEKLVSWVIRAISGEGGLVEVRVYREHGGWEFGYLPVPPPLLFPLLVPHLRTERYFRSNMPALKKTDPRKGHGVTVEALAGLMEKWGQDGRWEKLGKWHVEEAMEYADARGWLKKEGRGWWLVEEGYDGI